MADLVVVAHLAEQLFPTSEDLGSNPIIGFFIKHLFSVNWIEKKDKEKPEWPAFT